LIKSITFSRAARESGVEDHFWESYMPNSQFFSLFDNTQRALGGSISVIRDISSENNLLRTALGAMALRAAAVNKNGPDWMQQQASKLHVTALQQMRTALSSRRKPGLELLGAARIFSLYEVCYVAFLALCCPSISLPANFDTGAIWRRLGKSGDAIS
jgi:hypothetical protein